MNVIDTGIPDLKLIEPTVFSDERGFFLETYSELKYKNILGDNVKFVQDNHSRSVKGVLRGLHFQCQNPQGKLVRVVNGSVFDVAVDLRQKSASFGQWFGIILSAENKQQLWIPPGFAHGFQVLSDVVDFEYKCTSYYSPEYERTIIWNDPSIGIDWPINDPILSDKDQRGMSLVNWINESN